MKVGIKLGKVKKFGIGWCIPHRVVADNAKGWDRVKYTQPVGILKILNISGGNETH